MRHLGSIVLAIVFAPMIYILAGAGEVKFASGTATSNTDWTAVGIGVAALIVAGVLYSVLVMARISQLGPLFAAVLLAAAEAWAVVDASGLAKLLGTSVLGVHGAQEAPLSGLALFVAVPLVLTIISPRRWRGKESMTHVSTPSASPTSPAYGDGEQTSAETAAGPIGESAAGASDGETPEQPAAEQTAEQSS